MPRFIGVLALVSLLGMAVCPTTTTTSNPGGAYVVSTTYSPPIGALPQWVYTVNRNFGGSFTSVLISAGANTPLAGCLKSPNSVTASPAATISAASSQAILVVGSTAATRFSSLTITMNCDLSRGTVDMLFTEKGPNPPVGALKGSVRTDLPGVPGPR